MFRELRIKSYRGLRSSVLSNLISIAKRREPQMLLGLRGRMQPIDMLLYSFSMQASDKEILVSSYMDQYGECVTGIRAELSREIFLPEAMSASEWERYRVCCDEDETIRILHGEYLFKQGEEIRRNFYLNEVQRKPTVLLSEGVQGEKSFISVRGHKILYISPLDLYTNKTISASLYKGMLKEEKKRLLDLLRMFDERIMGIEMGMQYGGPITFVELEGVGLVPISIFGEGLKKVLTLACSIVKMRRGVLLIDEFETGIHKRALIQAAQWLTAVAKRYEVQVFLTTHSRDAIDALISAQQDYDDISAYRLEHYKSNIYVKQFQGTDLYQLAKNQGMEIFYEKLFDYGRRCL